MPTLQKLSACRCQKSIITLLNFLPKAKSSHATQYGFRMTGKLPAYFAGYPESLRKLHRAEKQRYCNFKVSHTIQTMMIKAV